MKVVMINGSMRKQSTYNIGRQLIDAMKVKEEDVTTFFLPKDMPHFCLGCGNCFMKDEKLCPHYKEVSVMTQAMDEADVLLFTSPVYVYHVSGQMKAFLDHYGYRWMVHRPEGSMFRKQAVIISTAAGGGMKSTNKDIKDSMKFWGVGKVHTYGKAVRGIKWDEVPTRTKVKITKDITNLAKKVIKREGRVNANLQVKMLFSMMRLAQKKGGFNQVDYAYWEKQGWIEKKRPWQAN